MTDLNNSVIMPREDFIELSTVAFDNNHIPSAGERIGSILQTTFVFGAMAGAVAVASWGWVKATDWKLQREHERTLAKLQFDIDNNLTKK